jgi:hypothetical protein
MQSRGKDMAMRRWAVIAVTLFAMTVLLVPITQAAEETAGRAVYHTIKAETMEVGDVPGHMIGVYQQAGLGFFTKGPASGQIATRASTAYVDTVKGKGTAINYIVYTFRDGSTVVHKATGTITPVDGGKTGAFEGTYEVAGGTGKFAGAKGKGTFKGERLGSAETGGDAYVEFTGTQ